MWFCYAPHSWLLRTWKTSASSENDLHMEGLWWITLELSTCANSLLQRAHFVQFRESPDDFVEITKFGWLGGLFRSDIAWGNTIRGNRTESSREENLPPRGSPLSLHCQCTSWRFSEVLSEEDWGRFSSRRLSVLLPLTVLPQAIFLSNPRGKTPLSGYLTVWETAAISGLWVEFLNPKGPKHWKNWEDFPSGFFNFQATNLRFCIFQARLNISSEMEKKAP